MSEIPKPLPRRKLRLNPIQTVNYEKNALSVAAVTQNNPFVFSAEECSNEKVHEIIPLQSENDELNQDKKYINVVKEVIKTPEENGEDRSNYDSHTIEVSSSFEKSSADAITNDQNEISKIFSPTVDKDIEENAYNDDEDVVNEILKYKSKARKKNEYDIDSMLNENLNLENSENNISSELYNVETADCNLSGENEDLLCIHIHRSDCLKINRVIRHPSVIVHIVDLENDGAYLQKSLPIKNVTYNQERSSFILPVMTRSFNLKDNKSIIPEWDEMLTFNETTSHIIKSSMIFFFEIVDFIDSSRSETEYSSVGWSHIAWAFLKSSAINNLNDEKMLRLQLYYVKSIPKLSASTSNNNVPNVYKWFKNKRWKPYPSTLYVTVKNISSGKIDNKPQQRSCTPFQPEVGSDASVKSLAIFSNNSNDSPNRSSEHLSVIYRLSELEWSRLPGQSCKIPNTKMFTVHPDSNKGCFAVKFSNSGLFLACGTLSDVFVYAIDGVLEKRLSNHQGLIYTICWFSDDSLLLSSSADCTTCIWDMKSHGGNPIQILPHPSFVYCSTFVFPERTIVTGCYDGMVRVWGHTHTFKFWQLHEELTGHEGYVTTLCAFKNKEFFSGDSTGVIIHWSSDEYGRWYKLNIIKLPEIRSTVINKLIVFPGNKRLLIHTRDSLLRTMDIKTCVIIQWYQGGLNDALQCNSIITPCGSLIFSVCEDGTVNVWETNTGKQLAFFSGNLVTGCGGTVDFHPFDHISAFSFYSSEFNSSSTYVLKHSTNPTPNADILLYMLQESGFLTQHEQEILISTKNKEDCDSTKSTKYKQKKKFRITKK